MTTYKDFRVLTEAEKRKIRKNNLFHALRFELKELQDPVRYRKQKDIAHAMCIHPGFLSGLVSPIGHKIQDEQVRTLEHVLNLPHGLLDIPEHNIQISPKHSKNLALHLVQVVVELKQATSKVASHANPAINQYVAETINAYQTLISQQPTKKLADPPHLEATKLLREELGISKRDDRKQTYELRRQNLNKALHRERQRPQNEKYGTKSGPCEISYNMGFHYNRVSSFTFNRDGKHPISPDHARLLEHVLGYKPYAFDSNEFDEITSEVGQSPKENCFNLINAIAEMVVASIQPPSHYYSPEVIDTYIKETSKAAILEINGYTTSDSFTPLNVMSKLEINQSKKEAFLAKFNAYIRHNRRLNIHDIFKSNLYKNSGFQHRKTFAGAINLSPSTLANIIDIENRQECMTYAAARQTEQLLNLPHLSTDRESMKHEYESRGYQTFFILMHILIDFIVCMQVITQKFSVLRQDYILATIRDALLIIGDEQMNFRAHHDLPPSNSLLMKITKSVNYIMIDIKEKDLAKIRMTNLNQALKLEFDKPEETQKYRSLEEFSLETGTTVDEFKKLIAAPVDADLARYAEHLLGYKPFSFDLESFNDQQVSQEWDERCTALKKLIIDFIDVRDDIPARNKVLNAAIKLIESFDIPLEALLKKHT